MKATSESSALILCVDDSPVWLAGTKTILEAAGYRVLTAETAQEALAVVRDSQPDLMLSEHLLAATSAPPLVAEAKKLRPKIKVLIVTGLFNPPQMEHADDFFFKLDGPRRLVEKVAELVKS